MYALELLLWVVEDLLGFICLPGNAYISFESSCIALRCVEGR